MAERLHSQSTERGPVRRMVDKGTRLLAYPSFVLGVATAVGAATTGNVPLLLFATGSSFLDFTQIKERNLSPEKQSWYNPERLMDKITAALSKRNRGSNRFNIQEHPAYSSRMLAAAA